MGSEPDDVFLVHDLGIKAPTNNTPDRRPGLDPGPTEKAVSAVEVDPGSEAGMTSNLVDPVVH